MEVEKMKLQEIALIGNIQTNAYKAGYSDGRKDASKEISDNTEHLKAEIHGLQQRIAWMTDKHTKSVENYENQIKNLQNKIERLTDI